MLFLPKTRVKSLLFVILALCGMCLEYIVSALAGAEAFRLFYALVLFLPLMIGLWHQSNLARLFVSGVLLILVVLAPLLALDPFDRDAPYPDVGDFALEVYPWVVVGLMVIHILGKYKSEFKPVFREK